MGATPPISPVHDGFGVKMIKLMVPAGVAVFGVLAATNPHEDRHARAMIEHARQGCGGEVARALCGGATALATLGVSYEDHLLYSTARLGSVETLGVLGQVLVVGE
jgi:hypothetical protein